MINLNVPIIFQKMQEYSTSDTRFVKVKIWLMHTGLNHNGTVFDKEVVREAAWSLSNTPILGFVENRNGEEDFSDHRYILAKNSDGDYEYRYIGRAVGVIPESNNWQFEKRLCDDGVEREFLTVEGLVWGDKWSDVDEIIGRDYVKAESMELHKDYEGYEDERGYWHFTKFKFYGACFLGDNVLPAMHNSTIERYSTADFAAQIQEKMEIYKQIARYQSSSEVDDTKFSEEEDDKNVSNENLIVENGEVAVVVEDSEADVVVDEVVEEAAENEADEAAGEEPVEEEAADEPAEGAPADYALVGDIHNALYEALSVETYETPWGEMGRYWIHEVDVDEHWVYCYDSEDDHVYGFRFEMTGDVAVVDFESKQRMMVAYRPFEDGHDKEDYSMRSPIKAMEDAVVKSYAAQIADLNSELETVRTERDELSAYRAGIEKAERDANEQVLFSKFDAEFEGDEAYSALKASKDEYSLEDLEDKLYSMLGRKRANFSAAPAHRENKVVVFDNEAAPEPSVAKPYGSLFDFMTK